MLNPKAREFETSRLEEDRGEVRCCGGCRMDGGQRLSPLILGIMRDVRSLDALQGRAFRGRV
jgi:hypothetical protein